MKDKTYVMANVPGLGLVRCEDMGFKVIKTGETEVQVEDGAILKIKVMVLKVSRAIDEAGNIIHLPNGEPYYHVAYNVAVVAHIPENLLKPPEPKTNKTGQIYRA